jgi:hypothetical protein
MTSNHNQTFYTVNIFSCRERSWTIHDLRRIIILLKRRNSTKFLTRKSSGGHQAKKKKGGGKKKPNPEEQEGMPQTQHCPPEKRLGDKSPECHEDLIFRGWWLSSSKNRP